jgi:sigma-E factor negative regulatory protein RseB
MTLVFDMGRRAWWGVAASAAMLLAGASASGQTIGNPSNMPWPASPDAPQDARAWLVRSHEAASRRNYQGVLVVSAGGAVSSSRVAHFADGHQQAEKIDALDGEPRGILRLNDTVHTLWPRARVAVVEQRDVRASFPSLLSGPERRVLDWYELRPLGQDRVAGFDADVVLLKARDGLRFSQRLWAERQTGLLLRADILAPNGQVIESAAFSELAIGVKPQIEAIQALLRRLDSFRVIRPALMPTSMAAEGWQLTTPPPGFKEVHCARRALDPLGDARSPVVMQVIYSDGLTHVSLFVEPFQPERHQALVNTTIGATHTLMVQRDRQWITAMGDVPGETLQRFVEALVRLR